MCVFVFYVGLILIIESHFLIGLILDWVVISSIEMCLSQLLCKWDGFNLGVWSSIRNLKVSKLLVRQFLFKLLIYKYLYFLIYIFIWDYKIWKNLSPWSKTLSRWHVTWYIISSYMCAVDWGKNYMKLKWNQIKTQIRNIEIFWNRYWTHSSIQIPIKIGKSK